MYKYLILKRVHSFLYGNEKSVFYNYILYLMPLHTYNTRQNKYELAKYQVVS